MMLLEPMIVLTGALYIATSLSLGITGRLLGPDYSGQMTVGRMGRFFFWALSGITALCGLSILYPHDLAAVSMMSPIMPLEAAGFLSLSLAVLNYVMADRAPPPLIERIMRMVGVKLADRQVIDLTLALPVVDHPPRRIEETAPERRFRVRVMAIGAGLVALVTGSIIWNSPVWGV